MEMPKISSKATNPYVNQDCEDTKLIQVIVLNALPSSAGSLSPSPKNGRFLPVSKDLSPLNGRRSPTDENHMGGSPIPLIKQALNSSRNQEES